MFKHMTLIVSGLLFAGGTVAEIVKPTTQGIVAGAMVQAVAAFIAYRKVTSK